MVVGKRVLRFCLQEKKKKSLLSFVSYFSHLRPKRLRDMLPLAPPQHSSPSHLEAPEKISHYVPSCSLRQRKYSCVSRHRSTNTHRTSEKGQRYSDSFGKEARGHGRAHGRQRALIPNDQCQEL